MNINQQNLHTRIGQALLSEAPPGDWRQLRSTYKATGRFAEFSAWAEMIDGSEGHISPDRDLDKAFEQLRSAMHDPERGIWYTAQVTISRELRLLIDFDYDHEPEWGLAISPLSYAEDLELFPRQNDAIPLWLRERVAEIQA